MPEGKIEVGDYVKGYYKGVHIVTKVETPPPRSRDGWQSPDVAHFTQVMSNDYHRPYRRLRRSMWVDNLCVVNKEFVDDLEREYATRIANLRALLAGNDDWE